MAEAHQLSDPSTWVAQHGDYLYRNALLRLGDREAAEEVVQETLLAALQGRGQFSGRSSERTWMVGILKHKVVDHLRRAGRETPLEEKGLLPCEEEQPFAGEGEWRGHWRSAALAPADWGETPAVLRLKGEMDERLAREQELRQVNQRLERVLADLDEKHRLLEQEPEKSERLLLNILPRPVAARLKEGPGVIAEHFAEVTVLFADLVGFTPLSARMDPEKLVELLNEVFSLFDELAEEHGLEKIKTIGDSYMAVGGLPVPRVDHAEAVAEMALDIQQHLAGLAGGGLQVRVGIHTGPVVAGVIGRKKFSYDLWGDTVNIASRMEAHGVKGGIQVTAATYERLKGEYAFAERGVIPVKGKGLMRTYMLVGRRGAGPGPGENPRGCREAILSNI